MYASAILTLRPRMSNVRMNIVTKMERMTIASKSCTEFAGFLQDSVVVVVPLPVEPLEVPLLVPLLRRRRAKRMIWTLRLYWTIRSTRKRSRAGTLVVIFGFGDRCRGPVDDG